MTHVVQQDPTPPTNPATAWCRACRNVVIEQNLWQFTTALPPTSQAVTNPTGVHSTGAFSCRLYSSLLGVNLFCTRVISLPGQLLLDGCCQGSPFKIKISLTHLAILACCCLLLFRSHCQGLFPEVMGMHLCCCTASQLFQDAFSLKPFFPQRIILSQALLFYNFYAPLLTLLNTAEAKEFSSSTILATPLILSPSSFINGTTFSLVFPFPWYNCKSSFYSP